MTTLFTAFFSLTACQSMSTTGNQTQEPQSTAAKQKEVDQMLKEWKELKPGLSRLVGIELELNLLITQLEKLSSTTETTQTSTPVATTYTPVPAETATHAMPTLKEAYVPAASTYVPSTSISEEIPSKPNNTPITEPDNNHTNKAADANYALQVASITEMNGLSKVWNELINKNPTLLSGLEPNFQKTSVNNTDYYRLKVGSFSTQQAASKKCADLKAAGLACIVVAYTGSNFAQLTN